jgi:Skp family chaperone for outer membrane proteins
MNISSKSLLITVGVIALLSASWSAGLLGVPYQMQTHRIGVCDVQVVLDQIPQGKAITEEFNTMRASMEGQLRALEADLRKLEQEAQQLTPGSASRRDVEKNFAMKNAELIWKKEDLEKEFAVRFEQRREVLVSLVRSTIEEVALEKQLDIVVNNISRAENFKVYVSVWAKKELDITLEVINRVSQK